MTHTPGPWEWIDWFDARPGATLQGWGALVSSKKTVLSPDSYSWDGIHNRQYFVQCSKANARLIAAAPETAAERDKLKAINAELLDALKGVVENFEDLYSGHPDEQPSVVLSAREIIAKAQPKP